MQPEPSMLAILQYGKGSSNPTIVQYAAGLEKMASVQGYSDVDLSGIPGVLDAYLTFAPRFDKRKPSLQKLLATQGWKPATYKQYQSDGRRMVEHVTGGLAARQARRQSADAWAVLLERAERLADAGLVGKNQLRSLRRIVDACRAEEIDPDELDDARLSELLAKARDADARGKLSRGAVAVNTLRALPTMRDLLPATPTGDAMPRLRTENILPLHLDEEASIWLANATTKIPDHLVTAEARTAMREEHSEGSRGIFAAALRKYVDTAIKLSNCPEPNGILSLFTPELIERVIVDWAAAHEAELPGALSARTIYAYAVKIRLCLKRNGHTSEAEKIGTLCTSHRVLIRGKAESEFMSAETEAWCSDLLADEAKVRIFELQHVEYVKRARQALDDAQAQGFDLVDLSDPAKMKTLPDRKRGRARKLLRRARMFGVCAAYAAIELEGAPFRKANTLGLTRSGSKRTFFEHATASTPHYRILIPNELLKNGVALTRRNQSMPPILLSGDDPGAFSFAILTFFLERIRPLFPGAASSNALFPPIEAHHSHLVDKTFDRWLLECSSEIGLPMKSHNFRHGLASIMINEDLGCIEQIAMLLGDQRDTVVRYYAFINRQRSLTKMQNERNARRAGYRPAAPRLKVPA